MMPLVAMRASVREVLPWSWPVSPGAALDGRHTHHMGHDADVAHIVGGPLQLDQLLGRDDRHRGGCVCAVSQAAGATVVPVGSSAMLRGESSRARFGGYQRTVGEQRRAGACGCDRGRDYIAARVVAAKMLKLSGRRRPGTPLPFAHRKKRLRHRWAHVLDSTAVAPASS
jgi:hypothetical protein